MHIHVVYCIYMLLQLLLFVVLVFASRRLFGMEFTPFGGMLVVGVTAMISRSGFHLLLVIWLFESCVVGTPLACCLLFLRLLRLVKLVLINLWGISQCLSSFWHIVCCCCDYRSGMLNSNTVNSKFHLIRSFFEILARILSFHV